MTALPIYVNGRFCTQRVTGVQRFAREVTRALQAHYGDRLHLLVPPGATDCPAGARQVGRLTGQLWEQAELPRYCAGGVLVNLGNTAPLLGRRQLVVIHDAGVFSTPEAYSRKFRLWYKTLHRGLVLRGARLVTVSPFSRGELARTLKTEAGRIAVVTAGTDHMQRISEDPAVLAANGLGAESYVLAVGTLAAHKNLAALGVLARRLRERGMVLAVTGSRGTTAFSPAEGGGLPADALYLGRVSDAALKALFTHAAAYVLPSRYEGAGLPAIEAMACGCAVVAADIPALRETCGTAAVFVPPLDPEAIAAAVLALLDAPARRDHLRQAGAARAAALTWAQTAGALAETIDALGC
jgi:glycosyltransferase involved in cell wall biosynthesis